MGATQVHRASSSPASRLVVVEIRARSAQVHSGAYQVAIHGGEEFRLGTGGKFGVDQAFREQACTASRNSR